ncbi:uncharacterized protein LOC129222628 [Uloborus diversus]|uniref:uncharacterized protein LOC129222628 n=1 Tax=Uloborus diversus TaxID=327109 RepID=UPI0024091370|nr:uncharacterized protein LOC129222628 [Uloborus diversus]
MTKLSVVLLICLLLHCTTSYYYHNGPQPFHPRVVYRHHVASYHPPAPAYPGPMPVPAASQYSPVPVAYAPAPPQFPRGAPPSPYYAPVPPPSMFNQVPYAPAASYQHNYYSGAGHMMPPPVSPRYPFKNIFTTPLQGAYSHYPKPSIFSKIKPYIFGNTAPRTLPHHPHYPNYFHPHHFTPSRPFVNRPPVAASHHPFPIHHHPPPNMISPVVMKPEKSCSCSLHVGQLTVYKHTDMRSSYSCSDLKDCNSFCTNLFSSEDLRAQTRSDACLILGKDTTVPWFRRDHVCDPHGVKNDTKLSVDLCCKNLQPC